MEMTVKAKIKIEPNLEQQSLLLDTVRAYQKGCNFVSSIVFETKQLAQLKLHQLTYQALRNSYALRSQMAQSVMKTVLLATNLLNPMDTFGQKFSSRNQLTTCMES